MTTNEKQDSVKFNPKHSATVTDSVYILKKNKVHDNDCVALYIDLSMLYNFEYNNMKNIVSVVYETRYNDIIYSMCAVQDVLCMDCITE